MARRAILSCAPRRLLLHRVPGSNAVHLTFDDGPHPEYTPRILDILANHHAQATFFVVGQQCEKYPEIVRRIAEEGHAIGNHTYSHVNANEVTPAVWEQEIRRADDVLRATVGRHATLVRPPYGKLRVGSLVGLWRAKQTIVLWNVDPKDYACRDADELRGWFECRPIEAGDIVLLHDVHPWAPAVLDELILSTQQRQLRLARIEIGSTDD